MQTLIPIGAFITIVGLAGLVRCIFKISKARKDGLDDEALKEVMQSTVALNLSSLFISAIGLMMVVIGVILK